MLLAFCALMSSLALAGASGDIDLSVQILEASNAPRVNAAPTPAERDLGSTLNYKSYRTLEDRHQKLAFGESARIDLPNGTAATITSVASVAPAGAKRLVRLRVQTDQQGKRLDAEYSVRNGGTVFVSAGKSGAEGVLILAIVPRLR